MHLRPRFRRFGRLTCRASPLARHPSLLSDATPAPAPAPTPSGESGQEQPKAASQPSPPCRRKSGFSACSLFPPCRDKADKTAFTQETCVSGVPKTTNPNRTAQSELHACTEYSSSQTPLRLHGQPRRAPTLAPKSSKTRRASPVRPNPSVNRSANGGPPAPGRWYAVHFHRPGAGVLPSSPA